MIHQNIFLCEIIKERKNDHYASEQIHFQLSRLFRKKRLHTRKYSITLNCAFIGNRIKERTYLAFRIFDALL